MKLQKNAKTLWEGKIEGGASTECGRIVALRDGGFAVEFSDSFDSLGAPAYRTAEADQRESILAEFVAEHSSKLFRAPRTPKAAS